MTTAQEKKWYQKTGYIVLMVIGGLWLSGIILGLTEDEKTQEENNSEAVIELPYDSLSKEKQQEILKKEFSGFYPPAGTHIDKILKQQFSYPDETKLSYMRYQNFGSNNIVAFYDYTTKNGFGVKSSGTIRVWYKSNQIPNDSFKALKYEILSNTGEVSSGEFTYSE